MVQAQTDNRNRTVGEVRAVITRGGGNVGADGSSPGCSTTSANRRQAWRKDEDDIAMIAIDAGATEFETDDEMTVIFTEPTNCMWSRNP